MSLGLKSYRLLTGALEPLAGLALNARAAKGKEAPERLAERYGQSQVPRPQGRLVWLHGASVGETSLLINLYEKLRTRMPDLVGLFTSQTLTAAEMFKKRAPQGAIHQMAPIDGPRSARRFVEHWRPDALILAEGEIWPNLIHQTQRAGIPMALVNARMTKKTLKGWYGRPASAREIFNSFGFIGAADDQTAKGLKRAMGRTISTVGNLKQAIDAPQADPDEVERWMDALDDRPVLLAASTHSGEEVMAIQAFSPMAKEVDKPLLILVPRHPERATDIVDNLRLSGLVHKQRSKDRSIGCDAQVLIADTMGEMALWMELSRAIYLGGANKPDVGGHNPIEPLKLRKPIFSGPHYFNFLQLMDRLRQFDGVTIGASVKDLEAFWRAPNFTFFF